MEYTLVIKLGYRGSHFAGIAYQPSERTVAGEVKSALSMLFHRDILFDMSGRTDAGVHATAQHISFPVSEDEVAAFNPEQFVWSMTALTPSDISIISAHIVEGEFSARFDAISRSYRYSIATGTRPTLMWDYSWWYKAPLDADAMNEAAQVLVGEHDFKSFCKAISAKDKTTMRCVNSISVSEDNILGDNIISVDICGNAFLHNMVRNIVGSLVEVGRGKRDDKWLQDVMEAKDRKYAGMCAPAKGLVLVYVEYPKLKVIK